MHGWADDVPLHIHRINMVLAGVLAKYSLTLSAYLYTWKCSLSVKPKVFSHPKTTYLKQCH